MALNLFLGLIGLLFILPHVSPFGHDMNAPPIKSHHVPSLTVSNFNETLQKLPQDDFAYTELFASWCPACRMFAPSYDKVGAFLNANVAKARVHPFRIDCATEIKLCGQFSVPGYPCMVLARVRDLQHMVKEKHTLYPIISSRQPKDIVEWVGKQINVTLEYVDIPEPPGSQEEQDTAAAVAKPPAHMVQFAPWTEADVVQATLELWEMITGADILRTGEEKRTALFDLTKGWAEGHPAAGCRAGAQAFVQNFQSLWPNGSAKPSQALEQVKICGSTPRQKYVGCASSIPGARGYTCGLWALFHAMAVRLPEDSGGAILMEFLNAFGRHFFLCDVCTRHFKGLLEKPSAKAVVTREQGVLWLWSAHNAVNERLMPIEAKYGHSEGSDPEHAKAVWPTVELCGSCRHKPAAGGSPHGPVMWDMEEVFLFMLRYYSSPGAASALAAKARVIAAANRQFGENAGVAHQHSTQALPEELQGHAGHQDRRLHTAGVALFLVVALALYFMYYRQGPGSAGLMATLSGGMNGRSPSGGLMGSLSSSISGTGAGRAASGALPTSNSGSLLVGIGGGAAAGGGAGKGGGSGGSNSPYRSLSGGLKRQHGF